MKQSANSPTRSTPVVFDENPAAPPDTEQNKDAVRLLSEAPIFIPRDDEHYEEDNDLKRDFWLSWLAHAAWMIPALFLARWFFISFFGGHAPDYDFVIHWIDHLGK